MSDLISLHCPSCGGQLQFQSDSKTLFCTHCGSKLLYKNGGLMGAMEENYKASARHLDVSANLTSKQSSQIAIDQLTREISMEDIELSRLKSEVSGFYYIFTPFVIGFTILLNWFFVKIDSSAMFLIVFNGLLIALMLGMMLWLMRSQPQRKQKMEEIKARLEKLQAELKRHKDNLAS